MIMHLERPTASLAKNEVIQKKTDTHTNRHKHAEKPLRGEKVIHKGNE